MSKQAVNDPESGLGKISPYMYWYQLITTRSSDYFPNTEKSHLAHSNCFLLFHSEKHPCDCGEIELASVLEHLAINRKVSGRSMGFTFPVCPDHDKGE
ncbi:MAG: hypothetical protein KME56_15850 [Candidatus Thiodiazotropha sp. (ex Ctena orbiculata)]|uniref:Uncharacterized protein n=1 Tax=Candidatus Thiodiazotropha taylori TaxID=2792791 RepID=A0A944QUX9_9GAMM|nr:hypothetical protein [Candidatus Thiodiazotropha taylori]MBT2990617.1 hypothetical protein [Candidatus Thiodiazotropha taylori]MBT2998087.1 hypothetical protein [Candidatus Thiodiazotropha taylori]MBT3002386.1 hypothetical protein [Candidatus Thiodiazotropha taylori]MBV2107992.1 hypothetical protein [Candidatus Thiodiazotropha taylori]